jgi:hypothetical protein
MALETYELVVSGTLAGQFVQNIFHVNVNNVADDHPYTKALQVLNTLNGIGLFFAQWCNITPTSYLITSARCRRILSGGGPTAILLSGSLIDSSGNRTGNISSAQVNPVLVWITDPRPDKTGRTFVPGISETDIDAMVYIAAWITAVNIFITQITASFTLLVSADAANFGVYRRILNVSDSIDFGRISPVVGTQRRRLHPV